MNTELFLANRITFSKLNEKRISKPVISISIIAIVIGIVTMIISISVMIGFKDSVYDKLSGFASHMQIVDNSYNKSFEFKPISTKQDFYPSIVNEEGIEHIQVFATKSGIIKTDDNFQGVVFKGVSTDFDKSFFQKHLKEGRFPNITDSTRTKEVLISKQLGDMLNLKVGSRFITIFNNSNRSTGFRKFTIVGLYQTDYEEFDKLFVLGDIKQVQKLNRWSKDQVSGFEIYVDKFAKISEYSDIVSDKYVYKIHDNGSKLRIQTVNEIYPGVFQWMDMIDMNVWIIIILMIVVAGFNMTSGLLVTILERTNMIGVLKSIGYTNWSLRKIFLYQSGYIALKGLLWGNIIGIGFCLLQQHTNFIPLDSKVYFVSYVPVKINLIHILLLNIGTISLIITMLIIPSYIISKLSPAKTIKFE